MESKILKKSITLLIFITAISITEVSGQFNFGVKGGVNSNKNILKADNFRAEATSYGWVGGIFLRYKYSSFSLEPQVLYSQKMCAYSYSTLHNSFDSIFKGKGDYIDVPVLIGFHLGRTIKLHAGPVFSFLVKNNLAFEIRDKNVKIDIQDNSFKNINYGFQIGGNLEISNIIVGVIYERSLQGVTTEFKIPNTTTTFIPDARNSLWQFTIGYKFRDN